MDVWEDIEAKVNCDTNGPVVKTSNKVSDLLQAKYMEICITFKLSETSLFQEISSILKELRRVQRQLEGEALPPFANTINYLVIL